MLFRSFAFIISTTSCFTLLKRSSIASSIVATVFATLQKMVNTPEQIKKNAAMILLGAVTVLVIAGFILFVILEIRLWLLEQTLKKQYEQADMD